MPVVIQSDRETRSFLRDYRRPVVPPDPPPELVSVRNTPGRKQVVVIRNLQTPDETETYLVVDRQDLGNGRVAMILSVFSQYRRSELPCAAIIVSDHAIQETWHPC